MISNFSVKTLILPGGDCFFLNNNELFVRADAPIDDSIIRDRLISVTVKATEDSLAQRSSQVVVNIPVSGDDHQPHLQDFYEADVLSDWSGLSGNTTFTATDDDVLIPNNCNFRLIPGSDNI